MLWQKSYGGDNSEESHAIQQTSDGGYIVAGHTASFDIGSYDLLMLKLDSNGTVSWTKTYGRSYQDYLHSFQQTSDGGYIVVGDSESSGSGKWDIWVLKLDSKGEVSWQKTYGGSDEDYASSVDSTEGGGYVLIGSTKSFGSGASDIVVLKLTNEGDISWQKTYGDDLNDLAFSVKQISGGEYISSGYTASFGAGDADFFVLKMDSTGAIPNCSYMDTPNVTVTDTTIEAQKRTPAVKLTYAMANSITVTSQNSIIQKSTVCAGGVVNSTTTSTASNTTTTTTTTSVCPAEVIYQEYPEELDQLRSLRDNVLSKTPEGQEVIRVYYEWSPLIVKAAEEDEEFKKELKVIVDEILLRMRTW